MTRDLIAEWRMLPLRKMKPKTRTPKTIMFTTRLDVKQLIAMREIKQRDGIALAKQLRKAIAMYLETTKSK